MATLTEKMDQVIAKIGDMETKLDVHLEAHKSNDTLLHELDETVGGNGKPGLVLRVDRLESAMNVVKWATGIIAGSVLIDIVSRFITLLK